MDSRVVFALVIVFAVSVVGHSYMTIISTTSSSTVSRTNQKQTNSGCRGPACLGPCDTSVNNPRTPPMTISRNAPLNIKWPRNNHAGGFIRFAWSLTSGSDVHANFDNGVQQINCHEVGGCGPDSSTDPNGGDSGTPDGSVRPCQSNFMVPTYLSDGNWTLQWSWFGGAFALGDYYSCADFTIAGGPTGPKPNPIFIGGDYGFPGQNKCKFFNTDRLHVCVNEPCSTPIYPAQQQQSGPAFGFSNASSSTSTSTTAPLTTRSAPTPTTQAVPTPTTQAVPTPTTQAVATPTTRIGTTRAVTSSAVTSGALTTRAVAAPLTTQPVTSNAAPLTTKAVVPVTSAVMTTAARKITTQSMTTKAQPLTTKSTPLTTRSRPLTTNAGAPTTNCANLMTVVPSTVLLVELVNVDAYETGFQAYFKMTAFQDLTDWAIKITWPAGITNSNVQVYDAAELVCAVNSPDSHVVVDASYNDNLETGIDYWFEIDVGFGDGDGDYIKSNTKFQVYRR